MKQTFTINADRVRIVNDARKGVGERRLLRLVRSELDTRAASDQRRADAAWDANRDAQERDLRARGWLRAVDPLGQQEERVPEGPGLEVDEALQSSQVGRQGQVPGLVEDLLAGTPDVISKAHQSSPQVAGSEVAPSDSRASTLRGTLDQRPPALVEDRAPSPNGAPVAAQASPAGAATPTVYYQDRLVTLYLGDCLAAPELWTHADVLITDPPYGLGGIAGAYGMSHRTIENDLDTSVRDRVLELWGDKPAAVFGTPRLEEPPGGWRDRLVWDKQQLGLNGGAWRYAHETIFVRGEGWHRISDASSSILRHSSQANRAHVAKHIHSKPEKLLADLIAAAPTGLIVDTFAGGGSTIAAARALGREIIAFELSEEHCASTVDRLTSRLDLFGGEA